ncbi:iron-sulfur protein [Thermoplasma volcanium GSS1]|uniref:Iron-sulfur protein n=1 Tax=Thermoplasma volcanium (strain ATCC 51530 / DSM 4299 / JCM 9571 / NBRC 15438 / GSS1) TaxID=273116 RepID=Q97B66_THEVO|nr:lactate utilization protein B [Thermoplasma volcanium]BAB59734.1 iron-sulfur protein [Thermoplasma volcanium GSS1]
MNWSQIISLVSAGNYMEVEKILQDYPYIVDMADHLREQKLKVIANLDTYVKRTMDSVEKLGGHAYLAKDKDEARKIIGDLVGEKKTVVFSKTNVAYEIGLREFLQERNNEVWETDLGEYLVQISRGWPTHIVAPALDMTREEAAKAVKKIDPSINENSKIEDIVAAVRKFLMSKYVKADVGITGANAVAADSGSVALVENEGNIRIDTVMPPMHIAVTGIDKIVPTMRDALDEVMVQAAYAGIFPPTYINVTSGPSSTADIELRRVSPATGPKDFHLVLIDNGRLEASKNEDLKEALLCIKCGRCYFSCPIYRTLGKEWISTKSPYNGPTGVMWNYITNKDPWPASYCVHSGGCKEVCPMKINIPEVIKYIKFIGSKQVGK